MYVRRMFSWASRHFEGVYGNGWVTEAKKKRYRDGDVEVDYNWRQTRVGVG